MIIYFSATGNSKHVAQSIAAASGDSCYSIEDLDGDIFLEENEKLGIISPVYMWQLPINVREFLSNINISTSKNNYIYFIATYGTTPGYSGKDIERILNEKDVKLNAKYSVIMPDTWIPWFDLSNSEKVGNQKENAERVISALTEKINTRANGNFMNRKAPYLVKPVTNKFYDIIRNTKKFSADDSCIGCEVCAKNCPVKAIEMKDNKPQWVKEKCALCLRCYHCCPKNSIVYCSEKYKKHGQYRYSK